LPTTSQLNLVRHAVARNALQAVARTLWSRAIPVLPLKGVWLQACVYNPPEQRRTTDVDVLVPEPRYAEARALLRAHGWVERGENVLEASLRHGAHALPLDLHRSLFTRASFALPTEEMFARARPDSEHFGVEVWLPDPMDGLGHLIGHFVKSRGTGDDLMHLRDFAAVGHAFALDPEPTAARLSECGLARAARYALSCAHAHAPDPFVDALLAALPSDPLGAALGRAATIITAHTASGGSLGVLGALPGFLLEPSLAAGARALALRLRDRASERRGYDRIDP
jgi:hypothetical protein